MSDDDSLSDHTHSVEEVSLLTYNDCVKEAELVKQTLRDMLTEDLQLRGTVCVAGSASLHWYLLTSPQDGLAKSCLFQPGDTDIFVYGPDGQTEVAFKKAVYGMINQLQEKGYMVGIYSKKRNFYVHKDVSVLIIDVKVVELEAHLSFIQCPHDSTVQQVVSQFDINVVKVIYNIATGELSADDEILQCIQARKGVAKDFYCQFTAADYKEVKKVRQTLLRIAKFTRRGFSFAKCLNLKSNAADCTLIPSATTFPEHKELERGNITRDIFMDVVAFLKETFPKEALCRGIVGLFGEWPLMNVAGAKQHRISKRVIAPWKVCAANVCICSAEANSALSFRRALQRLKTKMRLSSMYTFTYQYHFTYVDGMPEKMDVGEFNIEELGIRIRFVCCPEADNVCEVAQQSVLGIKRIWYDFTTSRCRFGWPVRAQL